MIVDQAVIQHNYSYLKQHFKGEGVSAVAKDNAYALGVEGVIPALSKEGCRHYFVATLEEARALRPYAGKAKIYILNGVYDAIEPEILEEGFVPVLISYPQLERWVTHAKKVDKKLKCIIHFDTGMSRSGFSQQEAEILIQNKSLLDYLDVGYWMSHLACSDQPTHPLNEEQRLRFQAITSQLPSHKITFVNSDGVFLDPKFHCDLARPGLSLYGYNSANQGLKSAVSVYAKILQIRPVRKGETIGYGATHTFEKKGRVATLATGYAHGWTTLQSNKGFVAFKGRKLPIVGRVSMDLMGVDISAISDEEIHENQWIELLGPTISPKSLGKSGLAIPYEIILSLRNHYRVYV